MVTLGALHFTSHFVHRTSSPHRRKKENRKQTLIKIVLPLCTYHTIIHIAFAVCLNFSAESRASVQSSTCIRCTYLCGAYCDLYYGLHCSTERTYYMTMFSYLFSGILIMTRSTVSLKAFCARYVESYRYVVYVLHAVCTCERANTCVAKRKSTVWKQYEAVYYLSFEKYWTFHWL